MIATICRFDEPITNPRKILIPYISILNGLEACEVDEKYPVRTEVAVPRLGGCSSRIYRLKAELRTNVSCAAYQMVFNRRASRGCRTLPACARGRRKRTETIANQQELFGVPPL